MLELYRKLSSYGNLINRMPRSTQTGATARVKKVKEISSNTFSYFEEFWEPKILVPWDFFDISSVPIDEITSQKCPKGRFWGQPYP